MLCNTAFFNNIPIMVDAEESWIQKAIDDLTCRMMEKYNKEKVVVINTFQMYRKDRLDYLVESYRESQEKGYKIGAKLVRGAYMEKERARAAGMGYISPIQANKEDTDKDYNAAVRFCMQHLDELLLVVATHNEESAKLAAGLIQQTPYKKNHPYLWFSQLLGMCDHISFTLASQGYNVAKYVPYGPVKSVTPYLIRRADENSSVAGQAVKEMKLLRKEIRRRKAAKTQKAV
jgi:proline dehydrogenase